MTFFGVWATLCLSIIQSSEFPSNLWRLLKLPFLGTSSSLYTSSSSLLHFTLILLPFCTSSPLYTASSPLLHPSPSTYTAFFTLHRILLLFSTHNAPPLENFFSPPAPPPLPFTSSLTTAKVKSQITTVSSSTAWFLAPNHKNAT